MDKIMDNMGIFDYVETPEGTYEYTAGEISNQFAGLVKNGVVKGVGDQFNASVVGLQITLGIGEAWLLGHHGEMIDQTILTSDPVSAGMQKICSVVLDVDITNQQMGISLVAGTQAESPSAPELTQTEARYQQEIWQALVHSDGTITLDDKRVFIARLGDLPTLSSINLLASNWSGVNYTLTVPGVNMNSAVEVLPGLSITEDQLEALQGANIQDGGQAAGSITLKAFGDVPTVDIPIRIIVRGDLYT